MSAAPDTDGGLPEFDVDKSTAESWDAFGARLADVLSVMDEGATLTIGAMAGEHSGRPPAVVFRGGPDGRLIAEASGNARLGTGFQLTDAQAASLTDGGWTPSGADEAFVAHGDQEHAAALAALAVGALRDVFGVPHPAFLAPDQLAEILTPPPVAELPATAPGLPADELVAVLPASRAHLDSLVDDELTRVLGHPPVRDAEGDFGIRVGSTMVFVRSSLDGREVLVFSPVVHDVEGRSRAMEVLSDLNSDARFVRFLLIRDRVFLSLSVYARPFVPAHLRQALEFVSLTADSIDNDLAAKLRGRTTFADDGTGPGPGDPPS